MDKQHLTDLIDKGYTVRKISQELNSSFTNVRYWMKKYGINTKTFENSNKQCKKCNGALKGKQTVYCSKKCSQSIHQTYCPTKAEKSREIGIQRKIKYVMELGGKCQSCGYNKNLSSLTFHHINPDDKLLELDLRRMSNTKISTLDAEVKKCKLLCRNCHSEEHYPKYTNWWALPDLNRQPVFYEKTALTN